MITTPIFKNTIVLFNCPIVDGTTFKSEKKFVQKTKTKQHSHNSEKHIGCNELIARRLNSVSHYGLAIYIFFI
jgi:hypothetical protein